MGLSPGVKTLEEGLTGTLERANDAAGRYHTISEPGRHLLVVPSVPS